MPYKDEVQGWRLCLAPREPGTLTKHKAVNAYVQRWLLGVEPVCPGFAAVRLAPARETPWTFEASIPTPRGPIIVSRYAPDGVVRYSLPPGAEVAETVGDQVVVGDNGKGHEYEDASNG